MMIISNPANRLYDILETLRKNCTSGRNVKDAWATTFDIAQDESAEEKVFLSVVQVVELIEKVKKVVNKMESNAKENLIKEITQLEKEIMNIKLVEGAAMLKQIITDKRMASLGGIILALDVLYQYSNIEDETVLQFREKIECLIKDIDNLDISVKLKESIIVNLKQVDSMIDNYKLYGVDGIKSAVENSYGSIMLNKELSEAVGDDSKLKETIKNILNLFGNINTVVTFTKNVAPIAIEASEIASRFFLN
ncbi:hypothetical protein [Clostridium beijerinckii]|uniref:hypothetical protein n=1 Tax=Clostridium beijerinckii TaxID=1520 RepID=UPI00157058CD|nr:hypothetical protein [Clostridium beijerinckii]NRT73612.1 hypothetical protein [Clostridium beijerinckii]